MTLCRALALSGPLFLTCKTERVAKKGLMMPSALNSHVSALGRKAECAGPWLQGHMGLE